MNIAMMSYYLPSGSKIGVGYQAHYMANAMVRRGHTVTMYSPCPRPEGALYQLKQVDIRPPLRTFRWAWALRRQDFTPYDVVHFHGDDYWQWGRPRPVHVRTMHGSCLAEALHVPGLTGKVRMLALAVGETVATFVADETVGVSRNTLRYFPWVKRVIWNGVDLSQFHPGENRCQHPAILFVGTYWNRKRGKLLMEAFQRDVLPAIPDAELWMVCEDAPLSVGVTVTGRLSTADLADLYRRAWVFCLPSTYEGFGVPYIEAMASGIPVVATPNVGACEVLDNGRFGLIAKPDQLGAALVQLLRDQHRRDRLASAGLERAVEFSWDAVVCHYEDLYRHVANTSRRRSRVSRSAEAQ